IDGEIEGEAAKSTENPDKDAGDPGAHPLRKPKSEHEAERAADERQHETLRRELARDSLARRPERETNGDLSSACRVPRGDEIHEIDGGDAKDQRQGEHDGRADLLKDLEFAGVALKEGRGFDPKWRRLAERVEHCARERR